MRWQLVLIVGISLGSASCGTKEQAAPEPPDDSQREPAASPQETWRNEAFIEHMHEHAEYVDRLNFALADGDLDAALTPAYWLSGHDPVAGLPAEWQQYVEGMREAARAVERAPDLDAARAAAEEITVHCQGCHKAAGVISVAE